MCLIAVAWKAHPRYRLVLIANRDEFHARPSLPADAHADAPGVYGGRDLDRGGSWLLASAAGRMAAVTNVRAGLAMETAPRSRGELTDAFVKSGASIPAFLEKLSADAQDYGRFNIVLGDDQALYYASNHPHFRQRPMASGVHALCNGDLDAPWPKAERARSALSNWLASRASTSRRPDISPLFAALADNATAADALLPDTGVGIELERFLSSPFIVGNDYGTRASTVLLIDDDDACLTERRFGPGGVAAGESVLRFAVRDATPT
jgi:uncharacterized protein with NRDE domain